MKFLLDRLKKVDRLLISSFIPPMMLSFLIALFVLTMQFFWLYIDEIMGKGVGFLQIVELVSYLTISFVPLALPLSVILASVMVFGNLGERYELASLKSAGISLIRVMKPLIFFVGFISLFSFVASNYIIPKSNLKFLTRLYDIRRQKPALAIEPGIFNDDFYGYSIYVGKKHSTRDSIENVIVYNENRSTDLILVTRASHGRMYTADKGRRFVMELFDGEQVEETSPQYKEGGRRNYPLMRAHFDKYVQSFDLEEFEINNTDESRFKDNQKMLNNRELLIQIDTLKKQIYDGQRKVGLGVNKLFDSTYHQKMLSDKMRRDSLQGDTIAKSKFVSNLVDSMNKVRNVVSTIDLHTKPDSIISEVDLKPGSKVNHFYELLSEDKKARFFKETGSSASLVQSEIINVIYTLESVKKKEILHWQQFYQKFTLAFACIIFLFIGAPMGAIVRKGGFGYPLLISIIFFVLYIMTSKMFEKLTDSMVLNVTVGMWLTSCLMGVTGLYLTYRASKDMSSNFIANIQDAIIKWWNSRRKNAKKLV